MQVSVNKMLLNLLSNRLGRSATRLELLPKIAKAGRALPGLTDDEKSVIHRIWSPLKPSDINFDYWRFYKAFFGEELSAQFVPDNIYWSRIIRALNPVSLTRTYINKNLYPIIFKGVRQPKVYVNVIDSVIYNENMESISIQKAVDILSKSDTDIIIKPTRATSCGAGVKKITSGLSKSEIERVLRAYGHDYICQSVIRQSKSTEIFNKCSLNTFRVNTVNINGRVSCENLIMRHGLTGSIVDNLAVGGVACGMTPTGNFNGFCFNAKFQRIDKLSNGSKYIDHAIPAISDVIDQAIDTHKRYLPNIGHAAWDFAIDEDEKPVMIEVNLMLPGIIMEQLSSGQSIFGCRTEEVIDYARRKNQKQSWTEFVGGWE